MLKTEAEVVLHVCLCVALYVFASIHFSGAYLFFQTTTLHFYLLGVWELQCSWENSALQPNRHSLKCATLLSFCQHHHCVELSQARHLTDSQMGVVDFSNLTPSRCPLPAQWWGSLHLHTHRRRKDKFCNRLPLCSLALCRRKKSHTETYWSKRCNEQERELHDWVYSCGQTVHLTEEIFGKKSRSIFLYTVLDAKWNVT